MSNRTIEERRWAIAINDATFGVWDLDPRLDVVHYAPQWKIRLGFPSINAPDSCSFWRCRVHPQDFEGMFRSLRLHLDGFAPSYEMRFRLRSNGSGYRSMLSRGRVVARDNTGIATRMIGTMLDLTGRPSFAANHALATETPHRAGASDRLPFHAVLGVARGRQVIYGAANEASDGLEAWRAPEGVRLAEQVEDLLDLALHEAGGIR